MTPPITGRDFRLDHPALISLRVLLGLGLLWSPSSLQAQLRPLDPAPWQALASDHSLTASMGLGFLQHQRASLAGTEGRLLEVGNFRATWRTGRIALEVGGTILRIFHDERRFAPPYGGAVERSDPRRIDSGDYRVATTLLLTPPERPTTVFLRFGTRLPTTDNQMGLDRDQTDFFALFGGSSTRDDLRVWAEAGIGIFGTRDSNFEQSDVLLYALGTEVTMRGITPVLYVLGHVDGLQRRSPRGNEGLSEVRAGIRLGSRYWMEVLCVKGLAEFSPNAGLLLTLGAIR